MQSEQPIERSRADQVVVRHGKLPANHQRLGPCDHQEEQRRQDIHNADTLMIDRRDPAVQVLDQEPAPRRMRWIGRRLVVLGNAGCRRHQSLLPGAGLCVVVTARIPDIVKPG